MRSRTAVDGGRLSKTGDDTTREKADATPATVTPIPRRSSTNPFESPHPVEGSTDEEDSAQFHECHEDHDDDDEEALEEVRSPASTCGGGTGDDGVPSKSARKGQRQAPLTFDLKPSEANPALLFDNVGINGAGDEFISPLESAFLTLGGVDGGGDLSSSSSVDEDDDDEEEGDHADNRNDDSNNFIDRRLLDEEIGEGDESTCPRLLRVSSPLQCSEGEAKKLGCDETLEHLNDVLTLEGFNDEGGGSLATANDDNLETGLSRKGSMQSFSSARSIASAEDDDLFPDLMAPGIGGSRDSSESRTAKIPTYGMVGRLTSSSSTDGNRSVAGLVKDDLSRRQSRLDEFPDLMAPNGAGDAGGRMGSANSSYGSIVQHATALLPPHVGDRTFSSLGSIDDTTKQRRQREEETKRKSSSRGSVMSSTKKVKKRRKPLLSSSSTKALPMAPDKKFILKQIESNPRDSEFTMDGRSAGTPWSNLIILEELGTASSWFVLLLPYMALFVSLFFDSGSNFSTRTVGPLLGNSSCVAVDAAGDPPLDSAGLKYSVPLIPMPSKSCSYPFELRDGKGLLSYGGKRYTIVDNDYRSMLSSGVAFTSGPLFDVPTMSTFLFGDASFVNLSSDVVALVAGGTVMSSTVVLQRRIYPVAAALDEGGYPSVEAGRDGNNTITAAGVTLPNDEEWVPVSISKPTPLHMVCNVIHPDKHNNNKNPASASPTWSCNSPRIIDVLFSMPQTTVLTGGTVRVDVLFAYYEPPSPPVSLRSKNFPSGQGAIRGGSSEPARSSSISFLEPSEAEEMIESADTSNHALLLSKLASSTTCFIEHQHKSYAFVVVAVRLFALVVSFGFFVFWSWSMGLNGFFGIQIRSNHQRGDGCCCWLVGHNRGNEELPLTRKKRGAIAWWESPWLLFPERRYLFSLLLCLLLVQNPLLAYMYYHPHLYSSAKMHAAADSLIGIGIHGILMLWLCLMEGLQYHTASFARKRAEQQRKALQLQRAAKYLSTGNAGQQLHDEDDLSSYLASYYEQFGDVDGSGAVGALNLRLKHDPCGDSWADFLLPKLFIFLLGTASVVVTAVCRFPESIVTVVGMSPSLEDNAATLNPEILRWYNSVYVASSFAQIVILALWGLLIIRSAFVTGEKLRKEPFLSTRPAQLAFRILSGILVLGLFAILAPFLLDLATLIHKWTLDNQEEGSTSSLQRHSSETDRDIIYDTGDQHDSSKGHSVMDALMTVLFHASKRIPYSGTAASIGPGKIIYITACSLVAAFIFLPSSSFYESNVDNVKGKQSRNWVRSGVAKGRGHGLHHQRKDKRLVVTLARYTHTWRIFPLPIKSEARLFETVKSNLLFVGMFQIDGDFNLCRPGGPSKFGRGVVYMGRYMPVYCIEIACWLFEASWQAYYSPTEFSLKDDWAPGRMNLDYIGLRLEGAIYDESTRTQGFVASNASQQVDGEEDSIIVVAFRGTSVFANLMTDIKIHQVPLPEKVTGTNVRPAFQIRMGCIDIYHDDVWDLAAPESSSKTFVHNFSPAKNPVPPPIQKHSPNEVHGTEEGGLQSAFSSVSSGAKAVIRAIPMARQALPCVHEGFFEAYSNIRRQILEKVLEVLERQFSKAVQRAKSQMHENSTASQNTLGSENSSGTQPLILPKIYITGHSLGGALGQLLALDIASNVELVIESMPKPTADSFCDKGGSRNSSNVKRSTSVDADAYAVQALLRGTAARTDDDVGPSKIPRPRRRKSFPPGGGTGGNPETNQPQEDVFANFLSGPVSDQQNCRIGLQPPIAVYTYGQPRVGNHAFARIYKQRVPHTFRVVNEGDAATALPNVTVSGGLYKHAGLEVVLDEGCTGNTLVGPTVVETLFRFSKVRTSMSAHASERYRDNLESSFTQNELQEYYRGHGGKKGGRSHMEGNVSTSLPDWVTHTRKANQG